MNESGCTQDGSTQEKCSKAEHGDFEKSAVMEGSKELSDVFQ